MGRSTGRAALAALAIALVGGGALLQQLGTFGSPGCWLPWTTCTRVLFIGDSYTSVNDLPGTFTSLAWAGGHRVETGALTGGGETLAAHVADPQTASTITSTRWSFVVLQDQSENPALPFYRGNEMYPAVGALTTMIRDAREQPLLFDTWGHQTGWPLAGLPTYSLMQTAVDQGYAGIAAQLAVGVAPIGPAWAAVVARGGGGQLWQPDGVHPTVAGTYLAACVLYASLFRESPVGLGYLDGLPAAEASSLQTAAASVVLSDPARWGL
jgi:hypothetical protein